MSEPTDLDLLHDIVHAVVTQRGEQYAGSYGRFKQFEVDEKVWGAVQREMPRDLLPGMESALRLATHKFCRVLINALEGREDYDSLRDLGGYALLIISIKNATIPGPTT
jgi:hypothetical protein